MVKFHFKDSAGNKHTKTSSKAGACSYFFEKIFLMLRILLMEKLFQNLQFLLIGVCTR